MSSLDALNGGQTGLLSESSLSALQLRQQPFTATPADGDTYTDDTTAEQLGDIKQALITGDDLLLILGADGVGKSTLLSQLGSNSGLRIQCFSVKGSSRFSTFNLFAGMLEAFKRTPPDNLKTMLDDLIPCLQGMVANNTLSTIVLDDADDIEALELTRLLSGMLYVNSQDETLMRVALAGPTEFEDRIPELLPDGADMPYSSLTIEPLSDARAAAYLEFRLNQAGNFEEFPFNDRDISAINERAAGNPAMLHTLAAEELNQRHGAVEADIPAILTGTKSGGFLHSRLGKLALGMAAGLLIVGGLLMFRPGSTPGDENTRVVEQGKVETQREAERIRLLEEEKLAAAASATDSSESDAEGDSDAITADGQNTDAEPDTSDTGNRPTETPSAAAPATDTDAQTSETPDADAEAGSENDSQSDAASESEAATDTPSDAAELVESEEAAGTPSDAAELAESEEAAEKPSETADSEEATDATAETAETADATEGETPSTAESDAETDDNPTTNASAAGDTAADGANGDESTALEASDALESPNWILTQQAKLFTVQMIASEERKNVEKFLKQNDLGPPNSIFTFKRKDTTWFALVHGLYPSINAARTAVEQMPASALTNQPWIRKVGRIQSALKDQN
ncbi:MAG: AAA family ATPase [Granulosicoccus sp.]